MMIIMIVLIMMAVLLIRNLRIMMAILTKGYFDGDFVAILAMIRFLMTGIPLYFEPSNKEFRSDDQRASGNAEHFGS